jgi:hypothetical protein
MNVEIGTEAEPSGFLSRNIFSNFFAVNVPKKGGVVARSVMLKEESKHLFTCFFLS